MTFPSLVLRSLRESCFHTADGHLILNTRVPSSNLHSNAFSACFCAQLLQITTPINQSSDQVCRINFINLLILTLSSLTYCYSLKEMSSLLF
jgi:hypothetical protein